MGSSASGISETKVILAASNKRSTSERQNKECKDKSQFSSHQQSDYSKVRRPSTKSNVIPPPSENSKSSRPSDNSITSTPSDKSNNSKMSSIQTPETISKEENEHSNDNNDVETENNKGDENIENGQAMTDEDIAKFRREAFGSLRETALKVVALKFRHEQNLDFLIEVNNAGNKFNDSCFALEGAARENVETFRRDIAQIIMETNYFNLSCVIVMHAYKCGWHLEDNDIYQNIPSMYMKNLQAFSIASDEFATAMANEPGFVRIVKQMIEDCVPKYFAEENMFKLAETEEEIVETALALAYHMSIRESNIPRLRNAGLIECLKPYLLSPNNEHALLALSSLAGIINEDECDIINSNKKIVEYLLDCIRRGLKDKMRICEEGWYCRECCLTVKMLARNDANMKILVDLGALELLVELGKIGDEDEQYKSVSALWALSFAEESKKLINRKPELGVIDLLDNLKSSKNEKIKKACNGALWTLTGKENKNENPEEEEKKNNVISENKVSSKGHVMISYQWADQEVVKRIRDNIRSRGYKVWIDIEQMAGSSLQAVANGIQGADVFLMCISNKYKNSTNCRTEAEYAFQLRKHIIPLKMEQGYTPDGWLAFIVGSKLYYDFSGKYPFQDKIEQLQKDLDNVLGGPGDTTDSEPINASQNSSVTEDGNDRLVVHEDRATSVSNTVARISVSKETTDKVRKWTSEDVNTWIERSGLQGCSISKLTGGEIAEMAKFRVEFPEFFYKCLQDMLNITDLLTISKVVLAFHNLS